MPKLAHLMKEKNEIERKYVELYAKYEKEVRDLREEVDWFSIGYRKLSEEKEELVKIIHDQQKKKEALFYVANKLLGDIYGSTTEQIEEQLKKLIEEIK